MKLTVTIAILIAAFVIYRPIARWMVTPSETRAAWVEQSASMDTVLQGHYEMSPLGRLDSDLQIVLPPVLSKSNEQKRRLWKTYTSGSGHFGLASRYSTVEGAWIYTWLLAEDGKLRYIHDHTRDGGAPGTAVDTYIAKGARIGFIRDYKFVEGEPGVGDSPILVYELDIGRYEPARFY